ncbi:MAG TPA: DegV family protein [Dehalococcoidia bacterium]|jgi:DegV family protein with EDD domain|nr:DegV family protein [Dehalococcoidia bacterium]
MSKVGIVTDTISCLPKELVKQYGIRIVPTGLVIDGKVYRDDELSNEEFWKLFYAAKEQTTTNAATPGDFAAVFEELAKSTDSIVTIVVSKALSATHQAAVQGSEMVREKHPELKIEVIDSKTAAGAEGFIVLEAARAAEAGKSLEEVVQVAKEMIPKVKFVTAMDTLKYLIRSGRAPKTAIIGDVLQVKPIIGMVSGTGLVESLGRARGKRKALAKLVEMAKEHIDPNKPVHVMFHYTDGIAASEELKKMVTSELKCAEMYTTPYTPVMASSTGPVVAMSFYSD